jgi:predicted nucleic acid-binding Zn ribbon protein
MRRKDSLCPENCTLVERRIKPYAQMMAEKTARLAQQRDYRRNQAMGLVLIAAVILVWWLFHTNPKWIFPLGWWRP